MRVKPILIAVLVMLFISGNAMAMKKGGPGKGHGGPMPFPGLDVLTPVVTPDAGLKAVTDFIAEKDADLEICELWDHESAYKAELSDSTGQRVMDVLVDKLTGEVIPDMMGPMHRPPFFKNDLELTAEEATAVAKAFVTKNSAVLGYTLTAPELYPGHYKFHTKDSSGGSGIDIIVDGFEGKIRMSTLLGPPVAQIPLTQ